MAAALINLALEAPVLAAGIWSVGAIFYYGPTYFDKVGSWLHQNDTAPIHPPDPPITLHDVKDITKYITRPTHLPPFPIIIQDANNFTEDTMGPTHPPLPPMTYDKEKNVTKSTKNLTHPSTPSVSFNNLQNSTNTITSVVPTPTGGSQSNDSTLSSICDDQTVVGPLWCTLQALGFFSPVANFIYAIWLKIHYFFCFYAYHALLRPAINDYPIWRLLIITITALGLAILPCHARRSLRHKWRTVVLGARSIFSGGCFLIMTYEHQAFYNPCNEDRCIVAAGLVLVPFLRWIVPQGAFTHQWNALCEDLLEIWETVRLCAAGIWGIIAYPNRYSVGALGWVLLCTYWKEIIQTIENPGSAFNAIHNATDLSWDSAPKFLEAYNITESRRRIFQECTSVYGVPVLRLFALSMIPSVYYYLLHFAKYKNMFPRSLACFLPFVAIIVAGWHGFDPLDLASVTVGTLVDATMFYLGRRWTALGHFHLAFCYFYYWLVDLTIVPLLKAVGRLFLTIAMGSRKLAHRRRFVFRTLGLAFLTGAIGNVILFGWSWWKFGPLGTKHYFDTISTSFERGAALYTTIVLFTWFWISSILSSLIRSFVSILSSSKDYVKSYNWPRFNISAWIPAPNLNNIYDDLHNRTNGSIIYLPSRSPNCVNGVWDFGILVARGISTTISMGSKCLLHFGSKHVNNIYGFVARPFDNMIKWTAELWIQNQETFNNLCRFLFWVGALFGTCNSWRWIMGDGGGGAANGGPGHGPPGVPHGPLQNLPGPPSSPAGSPMSHPDPQETPSSLPNNDDDNIGDNSRPPPSGGGEDRGEDRGNDGGSDENDSPSPRSPRSPSSGNGDGGNDNVDAPTPSPRIVPPQLSPPSSPDSSPRPSRGSTQLPLHGPPTLSLPFEVNFPPNPPILGLAPSEQATELRRLARAEKNRIAEIERRKVAVLAQSFHEYHLRNAAATTIRKTYRNYRSNKTLKLWKKTAVLLLVQERKRVTAATRHESERLRKEEEDRVAEAARLEAERLHQEEEDRIAEVAHLEAERLRKAEEERVEAERVEAELLRRKEEYLAAERARLEAERLHREEEDRIVEAAHLEAELLRKAEEERVEAELLRQEEYRIAEAARFEAERLHQEVEDRIAEAAHPEAERLRKAKEERVEAERVEAERVEAERVEIERAEAERVEAERVEAELLRQEEYLAAERTRVEAERLRKAEEERVEAERVEAERVELARVKAAHTERQEREFKQKQDGFDKLALFNKNRTVRLHELERKRLHSEEQVQRENERIAAEQQAHSNQLAREREDPFEKVRKERERLQDVEKKRREKLAKIDAQNATNTPKKTNPATLKEREKARAEWMRKRREEKAATLATNDNTGDGKDAQKKRSEKEAAQAALKKRSEEDDDQKRREEEVAVQAARKKREEEEELRQAKEKEIADDLKQLGKQKELRNTKAQAHNALLSSLQVDKAKKHTEYVTRMNALQKEKKKRIRKLQERNSLAHPKTYEDDRASNNASTQPPANGTENAAIIMHNNGDENDNNGKISPSGLLSRPPNKKKGRNDKKLQNSLDIDDYPPPSNEKPNTGINSKNSLRDRLLGGGSVLSRIRRSQVQASQIDQTGGDDGTFGPSARGDSDPLQRDDDGSNGHGNKANDSKGNENESKYNHHGANEDRGDVTKLGNRGAVAGISSTLTTEPVVQLSTTVPPLGQADPPTKFDRYDPLPVEQPFQESGDIEMGMDDESSAEKGNDEGPMDQTDKGSPDSRFGNGQSQPTAQPAVQRTGNIGLGGTNITVTMGTVNQPTPFGHAANMGAIAPTSQQLHHPGVEVGEDPPDFIMGEDLPEFEIGEGDNNTNGDGTGLRTSPNILAGTDDDDRMDDIATSTDGPMSFSTGSSSGYDTTKAPMLTQTSSIFGMATLGGKGSGPLPPVVGTTPHSIGAPSTAARSRVSLIAPPYDHHFLAIANTTPVTAPAAAYEQELAKVRAISGHKMCIGDSTNTKSDILSTLHAHVQPKGWEPPKVWSPSSPRRYDSHPPAPSPSTEPAQTSSNMWNLKPGLRPPFSWNPSSVHGYNREPSYPRPGLVLLNGTSSTLQSGHGPAQSHNASSGTGSRSSNILKYREVEKLLKGDSEQQKARTSAWLESSPPCERSSHSSENSVAHITAPPEGPDIGEQHRVRREAKARETLRHKISDDPNEQWDGEYWRPSNDEIYAEIEKDESDSSPTEEYAAMEARIKKIEEDTAVTRTTHGEEQAGKADGDAKKKQQEDEELTGDVKMKEEVTIASCDAMSDDSDLSSVNSIDSEARREVEINIIRNNRCDQD